MKLRTQKDIINKMPDGTPPPLMSAEGAANAAELGAGLTFESAVSEQSSLPSSKPGVDPLLPPTHGPVAPDNAFELVIGSAGKSAPAARSGEADETIFKSSTTNHGLREGSAVMVPPLMSPEGKKLASNTAPRSAFK